MFIISIKHYDARYFVKYSNIHESNFLNGVYKQHAWEANLILENQYKNKINKRGKKHASE